MNNRERSNTLSTAYIGIDPGTEGAIAVIWPDGRREIHDIDHSFVDGIGTLIGIASRARQGNIALAAVLEHVTAMPKQGVVSSFKFGASWGHLRGALIALGIPILTEPRPPQWKAKVMAGRHTGKDKKDQKTAARDVARELYPDCSDLLKRAKDSDRAEALLLAHYGKVTEAGR